MIKEGYKETEIGTLPSDWAVQPIEFAYDILDSQRIPVNENERRNRAGDIPYYGANGIVGYIDDYIFNDDLILVAEDGGNFEDFRIRPVAYVVRGKTWVNNHAHVLKPRVGNDFMWMFYVLQHKDMTPFIKGGTRAKLNQQDLRRILVQLPPLHEQQKIADILSTVDEHISETGELIEKTKTLKQGMMQRLLTKGIGHTEFKETEIGRIPVEWEVVPLSTVATIISGGTPKTDVPAYWVGGNIPWATPTDVTSTGRTIKTTEREITQAGLNSCAAYLLPAGSILMTSRATIGACSINTVPMATNQGFKSLVASNRVFNQYLYYLMTSKTNEMLKLAGGSTFVEISKVSVEGLLCQIPQLLEQHQIASILTTIDDQIETYQSKLDALTRLKSGLMQQLLTGRIRVKV